MAGPVFTLEMLLGPRRSRLDVFKTLYTCLLLLPFVNLFVTQILHRGLPADREMDQAVVFYLQSFVAQHFLLIVVAVPTFLAGAITEEKAKGTLQLLLTTDLTPLEIIVGKLCGRLVQFGLLTLAGLPLLCFVAAFYGALDGSGLLGLLLLTGSMLFGLGSVSVWESVRSLQTRDAALRLYLGLGLLIVAGWAGFHYGIPLVRPHLKGSPVLDAWLVGAEEVLLCVNPLYVLGPAWTQDTPGEFGRRLFIAALLFGGLGVCFLSLATWRLRGAAIDYLEGKERRRRTPSSRKAVNDDPIRWREGTAARPLWRWATAGLILLSTTAAAYWIVEQRVPVYFLWLGGVAGLLASFVVGIRASGAVTGERERQTWDTVLITPLETWDLVLDKRNGILDWAAPCAAAFAAPVLICSAYLSLHALAYSICTLILAWTTMHFMASTGIWCSASSRSSWRSLVATVGTGYGFCLMVTIAVAFAYLWVSCLITPVVLILACFGVKAIPYEIALAVTVAVCTFVGYRLYRAGETKVWYAQSWIDAEERYGRTLTRSLTRALRKHYKIREKANETVPST